MLDANLNFFTVLDISKCQQTKKKISLEIVGNFDNNFLCVQYIANIFANMKK